MIEVVDELPSADRASVFAHAPTGVALTTPDGVLIDVNGVLAELLGVPEDELRGRSLFDLTHPGDLTTARTACAELRVHPETAMRQECRLVRADGTPVPVQIATSWVEPAGSDGEPHLVMIIEDISERKALEAQLVHRSLHDPLTGLPNRSLFQDRLWHALERGQRDGTPTCVLIMDLDGFKAINDELGHPMGDLVLIAFADRLRSVLRASDTAARLGGDEFSIVCENTDRPDAEVLAGRLRAAVTAPLELDGQEASIGISIGIGSAPGGEVPAEVHERVIRSADDAMYADKARRRRARSRPR
ncbi:GGDEF domain-containing protein [Blastococcus sp. TF02-09]|uniref:diguanylate cyclase domain-containing protein n=1 Tax=Blastococcus sp. TF02-09 TaxID=2250576 RepID=UPI000DE8AFC2|nr:diguanylate cyclase [Blastococcus sp. TF02-9]RBY76478.1 GGDEF domain-containing protein [Blastococcus sp. TF02-9]